MSRRMMSLVVLTVGFVLNSQYCIADDMKRSMLGKALVDGSPWSFTNKHVSLLLQWRYTPEGKLESMSSYRPDVWTVEEFTAEDTIIHPSTAGNNTYTFFLDKEGRASAVHSKNPSVFKSVKVE